MNHVVTTVYNPLGLAQATVDAQGLRTSYTYNLANRRTQVMDPANHVISWTYDAGRALTETDALGRVTSYAYDQVGNRTMQCDARGIRVTSTYGPQNELTGKLCPDGHRHTFDIDGLSRIGYPGALVGQTALPTTSCQAL